jgi:hypothetical protein
MIVAVAFGCWVLRETEHVELFSAPSVLQQESGVQHSDHE